MAWSGGAEKMLEVWKRSLPQNHGIFNHGIRGNVVEVEGRILGVKIGLVGRG